MKNYIWIIALISFFFAACSKDQTSIDKDIIVKYLKDNNLTAQSTAEGLYYIIDTLGNGADFPTVNSTVEMYYKGYLTDGKVFDQTLRPSGVLKYPLTSLITGWQIGVPKFKKGGKGKLLIPSNLGYGSSATGSIPANSVLIFDIELVNFY